MRAQREDDEREHANAAKDADAEERQEILGVDHCSERSGQGLEVLAEREPELHVGKGKVGRGTESRRKGGRIRVGKIDKALAFIDQLPLAVMPLSTQL